jgi:hypothetical protein
MPLEFVVDKVALGQVPSENILSIDGIIAPVLHVRRSSVTEINNFCNSKRCAFSDVLPDCYVSLPVVFVVIVFVVIVAVVLGAVVFVVIVLDLFV